MDVLHACESEGAQSQQTRRVQHNNIINQTRQIIQKCPVRNALPNKQTGNIVTHRCTTDVHTFPYTSTHTNAAPFVENHKYKCRLKLLFVFICLAHTHIHTRPRIPSVCVTRIVKIYIYKSEQKKSMLLFRHWTTTHAQKDSARYRGSGGTHSSRTYPSATEHATEVEAGALPTRRYYSTLVNPRPEGRCRITSEQSEGST